MYGGEYIVFDGDGRVRPFVYFVIQKTGCSSVKRALAPLFGLDAPDGPTEVDRVMAVHDAFGDSPYQIPHEGLLRRLRDGRLGDHLLFAFVRHPLDRLVSCYLQKLSDDGAQGLNRYEFAGQRLRKGMPSAEFARAVCRVPDRLADAHFRSQHLTTHDGRRGDAVHVQEDQDLRAGGERPGVAGGGQGELAVGSGGVHEAEVEVVWRRGLRPPAVHADDDQLSRRERSRPRIRAPRCPSRPLTSVTTLAAGVSGGCKRDVDKDHHGGQDDAQDQELSQEPSSLRLDGVTLLQR